MEGDAGGQGFADKEDYVSKSFEDKLPVRCPRPTLEAKRRRVDPF